MARLKIGFWNAGTSNDQLDRATELIQTEAYDVFCLWEVSKKFLDRLKPLENQGLKVLSYEGLRRKTRRGKYSAYIVIISRLPVAHVNEWKFRPYPRPKLRTRLFTAIAERIGIWDGTSIARWGMYVDVSVGDALLRVMNVNLTLHTPERRRNEFLQALGFTNYLPTVMCGDFNILESAKVQWLNGVLGGSLAYVFDLHRERREMEALFQEKGFWNPLRHSPTQKKSGSQLDHILMPRVTTANRVPSVYPDYVGSDHKPVFVEFDFGPLSEPVST